MANSVHGSSAAPGPRLLIVTTIASTIRSFMLPFGQHFRALGWRVDALANGVTSCSECAAAFDRVWESPWTRRPARPSNFLTAPRRVRSLVAAESYDLVHVNTPVGAFVTRLALRRVRRRHGRPKVVYTAHGFHFHSAGSPVKNLIFIGLEKLAGRWSDELVVMNQEDYEAAVKHKIVPRDRIHQVPGIGVDRNTYNPDGIEAGRAEAAVAALDVPPTAPIILMVAAFIPRKRHADALRSFARMRNRDAYLLLVGTGTLEEGMHELAKTLGIHDRVRFLGGRRDVPVLLKAAGALLLTSEQEGLPRCVMEAMSMGKPVVATDIRGNRDLLGDGGGILCPLGDIDRLAGALDLLCDDPRRAREIGSRGGELADIYDIEAVLGRYREIYERSLAGGP